MKHYDSEEKMIEILFEDNHQLVLNKPSGMLTQPDNTGQESLEALAKAFIKERDEKHGNVFLGAVHRIDKPVSGIVLFAKSSKGLSRLNEAIRNKATRKIYRALVEGNTQKDPCTLEHYLRHDSHFAKVTNSQDPEAKLARLHYRVLSQENGLTLLEIELETGRYHQIRAQMSHAGHPILGDTKYGSRIPFKEGAIALHHYQLEVPHPITGTMQRFEAPVPAWWFTQCR